MKIIGFVTLISCLGFLFFKKNGGVTPALPASQTNPTLADDSALAGITTAYITGKFNPQTHPDFVKVEKKYADRDDLYLRKETYAAFKNLFEAAQKDGIRLNILSATRNFEYQKRIWEGKWKNLSRINDPSVRARKIMEYSAMPCCSRHHWGTDIDISNLTNVYFERGEGKKVYEWMLANAEKHGFCQPYTKGRAYGYNEEKWHWSYAPLSRKFTEYARKNLKNDMISGFSGAETAKDIDVVKHYVLGINTACF